MSDCLLCGKSHGGMWDPWEWNTGMHQDCHRKLIDEHRIDGLIRSEGGFGVPKEVTFADGENLNA